MSAANPFPSPRNAGAAHRGASAIHSERRPAWSNPQVSAPPWRVTGRRVQVGAILLKVPMLDRRERDITTQYALLGPYGRLENRQSGNLGDRLVLEQLRRPEAQSRLIGARDNLNREDGVAPEFEEIVVNADLLDT